jgi:hypothetical protein
MSLIRSAVALIGLSVASVVPAGSAAASAAGHSGNASGDAGYVVTGNHLSVAETWVKLPDASRFAREMGSLAASVQLWTSTQVIDLKLTACTDTACKPGGKPVKQSYRPVLEVYDRATGTLTCSTAASGRLRCPGTPGSFSRARVAPGQTASLSLVYTVPYAAVFASANSSEYDYPVTTSTPVGNPALNFTQARIGMELGSTPWAAPVLRAPASATRLMSFDRPPPPPYAAEIANLNGHSSGLTSPWWTAQAIGTAPGSARAVAGKLWDQGYGLTVSLKP